MKTDVPHPLLSKLLADRSGEKPLLPADRLNSAMRILGDGPTDYQVEGKANSVDVEMGWPDQARTRVFVQQNANGVSLGRECDCEVGRGSFLCGHMDAAILHVRNRYAPGHLDAYWQHQWSILLLRTPSQPQPRLQTAADAPTVEKFLALILYPGAERLRVQPAVVTRNLNTQRLRSAQLTSEGQLDELIPADRDTHLMHTLRGYIQRAAALAAMSTEDDADESLGHPITDSTQRWRFQALAQALPLFWNGLHTQLTWSTPRQLSLTWKTEPGHQRLTALLDGAPAAGVIYDVFDQLVHVTETSIEPVLGNVRAHHLARMAPPLRPSNLEEVRQRLSQLPPDWEVPLPEASTKAIDVRVAPRLALKVQTTGTKTEVTFAFDYDGHRPAPSQAGYELLAGDSGVQYRVHRDRAAEQALLDDLSARLPMNAWPNSAGYWLPARANPRRVASLDELMQRLLPLTAEAGVIVEAPTEISYRIAEVPDQIAGDIDVSPDRGWLDVGLGVTIDGRQVDLLPVLTNLLSTGDLSIVPAPDEPANKLLWIDAGQRCLVPMPAKRLRQLVTPILDWLRQGELTADNKLRIRASAYNALEGLSEATKGSFLASGNANDVLERIQTRRTECVVSPLFKGVLREYQQVGLNWMAALHDCGFGGVLADDMGLGKTIQIIAHITTEKDRGELQGPVVVVVIKSALNQWMERFAEFAPHLKVLKISGTNRHARFADIADADVVITTWQLTHIDLAHWRKQKIPLMVLDETKGLKNARNLQAQAVREFPAARRIALGGTPLENHLGEYWATVDAVEPGVLGSQREFNERFRRPIEREGDTTALDRLRRRTAAIVMRRTKADVADQLPPKTVEVVHVDLTDGQREIYEGTRVVVSDEILALLQRQGIAQAGMMALKKMLALRQICASPKLLKARTKAIDAAASAKEEWIEDNVPHMLANGRKILIFSEWSEMLEQLAARLTAAGLQFSYMTGDSSEKAREHAIRDFKTGKTGLFLITRKTGGAALDLPEADTVIHYEPDWNPANEDQASDRAHRLSTQHAVTVYKLIARGTLEDHILDMQTRKQSLRAAVLDGRAATAFKLSEDDIHALLAPMEEAA